MAEPESKPGETPTTEQPEGVTPPAASQPAAAEMVSVSRAEWDKMQAALKEANTEAAKRRKEIERIEAERKTAEEAKLSDLEKAQKHAAELEAEIKRRDANDKKRAIAAKVGLPDVLALRIQGETDEEMETDAKAIMAGLPKPQAPSTKPINPGAGGGTGETKAERIARIMGA